MLCCLDPECCRLIAFAHMEGGEPDPAVARTFALSAFILITTSFAFAGGVGI